MKKVLFGVMHLSLPNLDASSGSGDINISDELYFEYQYRLLELTKLAQKVVEIAEEQGAR